MYNKRIKIFIIISALLVLLCLLRISQLQIFSHSFYLEGIAELKLQQGVSRQLRTIRGKIIDRKGRVLATNEPQFQLHINYRLCSIMDDRVRRAKLLNVAQRSTLGSAKPSLAEERKKMEAKLDEMQRIVEKCTYFGPEQVVIEQEINNINNKIWNLRTFLAWRRNEPDPKIIAKYNGKISDVPLSEAIRDFENKFPNLDQRLLLIDKISNIPKMNKPHRLLELKTDADVFDAQLEFMDTDGIEILPESNRIYPYGAVAAHTIGWVGRPQQKDMQLLENDKLSSYLSDEVCGREDGVEYVCEAVLRGRRGEELWDIDRELISRTETQFGKDVSITLDIELQKKIEDHLADCELNSNCKAPMAAVVLDVATGDILALVSIPTFDLNLVRSEYDNFASDSNEPLRNRALNKGYPPGSVIKPLILIAALESGKVTTDEIFSCPAQKAPKGWPSCWIFNQYQGGHDYKWQNFARNAIRGSCNIYFSKVADRIDTPVLQQWLFKFGYGHKTSLAPHIRANENDNWPSSIENRDLRQIDGTISSVIVRDKISSFEQIPTLYKGERRFFGIGQGNLRVTPLQAANALASIARGGVYKPARLFIADPNKNPDFEIQNSDGIPLGISPQHLDVVHDGMSAVVNEPGGTAFTQFSQSTLPLLGVKVYGKTGSTEAPENAWFGGFIEDDAGRKIVVTIVVEGGQSGPRDAAPLAFKIIESCIEAGYIGQQPVNPSL